MSIGPIMLDLQGTELSSAEIELLRHPNVGGIILFSRNYSEPEQLQALTSQIRAIRQPELLIGVDHEGGRVQRFRNGFTKLPSCRKFGELYDIDKRKAINASELTGWLMASELLSLGIDFSFAPVLDLDSGKSEVIGDRAFHHNPNVIADLAQAFVKGMNAAGMPAVGKHFPGHGRVRGDSHDIIPVDRRNIQNIMSEDLIPFERLINMGIVGIMPAHVIFPQVDKTPVGFSSIWLSQILRKQYKFAGTIFSDDISMAGAKVMGTYLERAKAALVAGCDMILVCNNRKAAVEILENIEFDARQSANIRLMKMYGKYTNMSFTETRQQVQWKKATKHIMAIDSILLSSGYD